MFDMAKNLLPGLDIKKMLSKKKELSSGICEVNIKGSEEFVLKMFGINDDESIAPGYID